MAKFTDHLIVLDLSILLPRTIKIEISLYCCEKLLNFGTNTHKPELYQVFIIKEWRERVSNFNDFAKRTA